EQHPIRWEKEKAMKSRWYEKPGLYLVLGVTLAFVVLLGWGQGPSSDERGLVVLTLASLLVIFYVTGVWFHERQMSWHKRVRTPENLGKVIYGLPIERSWSWVGEDLFKEAPDGCFSVDFLSRFLSGDLGSIRLRAFLELLEAGFIERRADGGIRF